MLWVVVVAVVWAVAVVVVASLRFTRWYLEDERREAVSEEDAARYLAQARRLDDDALACELGGYHSSGQRQRHRARQLRQLAGGRLNAIRRVG